ncbi:MAG: DUF6531 domain-containing protein [Planctomycetota bacterium]
MTIRAVPLIANLLTEVELGDIGPGEKRAVEIALLPAPELPVGSTFAHQNGSSDPSKKPITVVGSEPGAEVHVGYFWEATSAATGSLSVSVQDELTFWSTSGTALDPSGAGVGPLVANAVVKLSKPVPGSASLVFEETSGPSGTAVQFEDLPVGTYQMSVTAPGHGSSATIVKIGAGDTKDVTVFVPTQAVTYEWTVVPTEIIDEYEITIQATFETNVPVPIVTASPGVIDLELATNEVAQIDLEIANEGLVAVQNVRLVTSVIPGYVLTPLITDIGELAAQSSVVVPVLVELEQSNQAGTGATPNCTSTAVWGVEYSLECGGTQWYWTPIYYKYPAAFCGGAIGGGGSTGSAGVADGGPAPNYSQPVYVVDVVCEAPPVQSLVPPPCFATGCGGCRPEVASGPSAGGTPPSPQDVPTSYPESMPSAPNSTSLTVDPDSDPVLLFSGELVHSEVDLRIPGRGMDLEWRRYYRSRRGVNTPMGQGWDFGFNVWIDREGPNVRLYEGSGRYDVYVPQPDGTWIRDELFQVVERESTGRYRVTFPDGGRWEFLPVDGGPLQGALDRIVDRNGNVVQLHYDAQGRLGTIVDTLNRTLTIVYGASGYIDAVVDFTGRVVQYEHDAEGNLTAVTSPAVIGVPNALGPSDHVYYPAGLTRRYTYSAGSIHEALNHNLLTITDERGATFLVNEYSAVEDPNDREFDRVVSQQWGDTGDITNFSYLALVPSEANGQIVMKTIVNDRVGNVCEYDFDLKNRLRRKREYTGRAADADSATTLVTNRPGPPLRSGEPIYYETSYGYNLDSRVTFVQYPDGARSEFVYQRDLDPNSPRRTMGNLRELVQMRGTRPSTGEPDELVHLFEYQSDAGGCCGTSWLTQYTDPMGRVTLHEYDGGGNRTRTVYPIPEITEEWTYNGFGQLTEHTWPSTTADATGHRQKDSFEYYTGGPQRGYLRRAVRDVGGLDLPMEYEYDLRGNPIRIVDARGNDRRFSYDQRDLLVQERSPEVHLPAHDTAAQQPVRYLREYVYDEAGNLIREEVENRDRLGAVDATDPVITTTRTYGTLDELLSETRQISTSEAATTVFEYDSNRNSTAILSPLAVAGLEPKNRTDFTFDTRDRALRMHEAPGSSLPRTVRFDFDAVGNLVTVVEGEGAPGARTRYVEYDAYRRPVVEIDPMGNVTTTEYDEASNRVRVRLEGELVDVDGSASNVRLSETEYVRDELNRVILERAAWFHPATQEDYGDGFRDTAIVWSQRGELLSETNDRGFTKSRIYDGAGRLAGVTDAKGNVVTYSYDGNNNVLATVEIDKSDLGAPDETFTTTYVHDALDRLLSETDNLGGVMAWEYDARGNRVRREDRLANVVEWEYDLLDREAATVLRLTEDGTGSSALIGSVTTCLKYDQNSRIIERIDGLGNVTRYLYNSRDFETDVIDPNGAKASVLAHDVHGVPLLIRDPRGSTVEFAVDGIGRMLGRTAVPGLGVSGGVIDQEFRYDGRGQLRSALEGAVDVNFDYNSLGSLIEERGLGVTVSASRDSIGNPTGQSVEGGAVVSTTYDSLNRPQIISVGSGEGLTYRYIGPGRVQAEEWTNGVTVAYMFDGLGRVAVQAAELGGSVLSHRVVGWDAMSKKIREESPLHDWMREYEHDSLGRAVGEEWEVAGQVVREVRWALDGAGNRLSESVDGVNTAYHLDEDDQKVNQYTATPFDERKYAADGDLIEISEFGGGVRRLEYDALGRLARVTNGAGGVLLLIEYDALARRIKVETGEGSGTQSFTYFGDSRIVIADASGIHQLVDGWREGRTSMIASGGSGEWLLSDELDSPVRRLDAGAAVVGAQEYPGHLATC